MNSEELEQSLRAEFENHLKGVIAGMRDESAEFQKKIETDLEDQRSRFASAFESFAASFDREQEFVPGFRETVIEHLRLARDEGSQITANAYAEAERLEQESAPAFSFADFKQAIDDISSQDSQSSILKSLVEHAASYTPRGAFFIIKNEHFVGWKVFGKEGPAGEDVIRDIHFPISSDSILGKSVTSLSTVDGSYGSYPDDSAFLEALDFGQPDRMFAIPLNARGKGVAVMYADYGTEGVNLNTDALEALVRVAGMTVELLAAAKLSRGAHETVPTADFSEAHDENADAPEISRPETDDFTPPTFADSGSWSPAAEVIETVAPDDTGEFRFTESEPAREDYPSFIAEPVPTAAQHDYATDHSQIAEVAVLPADEVITRPLDEASLSEELKSFAPATDPFERTERMPAFEPPPFTPAVFNEPNPYEAAPFNNAAETDAPSAEPGFAQETPTTPEPAVAAPVVESMAAAPSPTRSRLSDRNVDLPIDVAEDERRIHNDARRFARLLVSEIKLYNEKKVQEGREAKDLYERLREAIDRSREMYDKRVQPPVAAKFDYFHYELVNALGDGDESRLGPAYPGAAVK